MFGVLGIANTVYHPADYTLLSRHVAPERIEPRLFAFTPSPACWAAPRRPRAMLFMHAPVRLARCVARHRGVWIDRRARAVVAARRRTGAHAGQAARRRRRRRRHQLAAAARAADPDELCVLLHAGVRKLWPAELPGGGARLALRHEPAHRQCGAVRPPRAERARRADRRLDRRPHHPFPPVLVVRPRRDRGCRGADRQLSISARCC